MVSADLSANQGPRASPETRAPEEKRAKVAVEGLEERPDRKDLGYSCLLLLVLDCRPNLSLICLI